MPVCLLQTGFALCRDVAQPGRALAWGARGRQFKSARPDHLNSAIIPSSDPKAGKNCRPTMYTIPWHSLAAKSFSE